MGDRVSAFIRIGGALPQTLLGDFLGHIANYDLATEWDGMAFDLSELPIDAPLELMAYEVNGGSFTSLETFCQGQGLHFARWRDAYPGGWDRELLVYSGGAEPMSYRVTENDEIVVTLAEIRMFGTLEAVEAFFAEANSVLPPLTIVGEAVGHG